ADGEREQGDGHNSSRTGYCIDTGTDVRSSGRRPAGAVSSGRPVETGRPVLPPVQLLRVRMPSRTPSDPARRASLLRCVDITVPTRVHRPFLVVHETHHVLQAALLAAYFEDLAVAFSRSDGVAVHVQSVSDGCAHRNHLRPPQRRTPVTRRRALLMCPVWLPRCCSESEASVVNSCCAATNPLSRSSRTACS